MSRPSGRIRRFRGAERYDKFQHGSLEENQAPEASVTREAAASDDLEADEVVLASHSVDAFFADRLAVCLEQVAQDFGGALANADVWGL